MYIVGTTRAKAAVEIKCYDTLNMRPIKQKTFQFIKTVSDNSSRQSVSFLAYATIDVDVTYVTEIILYFLLNIRVWRLKLTAMGIRGATARCR